MGFTRGTASRVGAEQAPQSASVGTGSRIARRADAWSAREDELVDRVLTAAGRHALTPDPAVIPPKKPAPPKPLTAMEEARLAALRQAALTQGVPRKKPMRCFTRSAMAHRFRLPNRPNHTSSCIDLHARKLSRYDGDRITHR